MVYQATYVISLTFTLAPRNPLCRRERLAASGDRISVVGNREGRRSDGNVTLPFHIYERPRATAVRFVICKLDSFLPNPP